MRGSHPHRTPRRAARCWGRREDQAARIRGVVCRLACDGFPAVQGLVAQVRMHLRSWVIVADPGCRYTHLMYSFAETTPDVTNITLAGSDPSLLPQFVKTAKKNVCARLREHMRGH
jgi:hypothetical protein